MSTTTSSTPRQAGPATPSAPSTPSSSTPSAPKQQQQQPPPPQPQDLTPYHGLPLRLTLTSPPNTTIVGLLFSHDPATGLVILETGHNPAAPPSYPANAAAAPSQQRTSAVIAAQGGSSGREPTGFKLVKERCIKEVEVLPQLTTEAAAAARQPNGAAAPTAGKGGDASQIFAKALSPVTPVEPAVAERREAAASREAQARASRIGVGVTEFAQEIFEGLSKTMPCRWHEKRIVVMDEMILSEPYDLSTLSVPKYPHPLLTRLASGDESVTPADLPAGEDLSRAKAKARSWERVGKVLEGERKRAAARRAVKGGGL